MNIRTFRPGDEPEQAAIYNEAARDLPKFKPATADEVTRRCRAADFDPHTRFYAEAGGRPVAYATFHPNGRVSYPWCRPGYEDAAEPLFERVLEGMRGRGIPRAFAAYRGDWPAVGAFFEAHGFRKARDMVNFVLDEADMPTRPGHRTNPLTPLRREDVPALHAMAGGVVRARSAEELERHLFDNRYFSPESLFVLRSRADEAPLAVGILVANPAYADPHALDSAMPCYRLGAFGTEGMTAKRVHGLFSFVTREEQDVKRLGLDLMGHAAAQMDETTSGTLAAQVPSDAAALMKFYQGFFRRQGSFPVWDRALVAG